MVGRDEGKEHTTAGGLFGEEAGTAEAGDPFTGAGVEVEFGGILVVTIRPCPLLGIVV